MPGVQEVRPEAVVEADAARDVDDVRADELADVRDLVDEADARREERVRRELHELGGGDVHAEDLGVDPACSSTTRSPSSGSKAPTTMRSGFMKSRDRAALGGELGIRDVADAVEAARVEPRAHLLARPDGDGALHDEERAARDVVGQLVDDGPDGERSASPEYVGGVPTAT